MKTAARNILILLIIAVTLAIIYWLIINYYDDKNRTDDAQVDGGMTVWSTAASDSKWFAPSESSFMINYRVDDLDGLLAQLKEAGVEIVGEPTTDFNGKFAWVMDPDGNKVELWEPMLAEEAKKDD